LTARRCFTGKIAAGKVSRRAGEQILAMLDDFERQHQARLGDGAGARQAALDAAAAAKAEAGRKADQARGSLIAQSNVLRAFNAYETKVASLRDTPGDFGFGNKAPPGLGKEQSALGFAVRSLLARDPWEIASWQNVDQLARTLRGEAHRVFADAIEFLRPKGLGFKPESARELDVLRALYGRSDGIEPAAAAAAKAFQQVAARQADEFIAAGGALAKREDWRLPNPEIDQTKVQALGPERFKQLVRDNIDREAMLDYATDAKMTDARFEQLLDQATNKFLSGFTEGLPSGQHRGQRMLANQRDFSRFFVWKSAESWQAIAEAVGTHASPFETMVGHMAAMAQDTAMLRVLGPNPEATKRFILDLFGRDPARLAQPAGPGESVAKATKQNRSSAARVAVERRLFEDLWSEVSGQNRIPVSTTLAQGMADVRHGLSAAQLGSALISSFTDPGTTAMIARFNGLPAMNVIGRAVQMATEKGSEIFAAQQGLVADTLAHAAGASDKVMGESIRTGFMAKLASANIRASGLRRWTAMLRAAFGLEMMAHAARVQKTGFEGLEPRFREALSRYGIGEADWKLMQSVTPHEPRPNALLLRPADIAALDNPAARAASEKFSRLINTEMDYAVIEGDPVTRAMLIGSSQPGTLGGEVRRATMMYRQFPASMITMHMARFAARGWDGSRLGHAALTMTTMTILGALSMQMKEVAAGRDPLSLDPTTGNGARAWGKAMLQGGGLGVFGDVLFVDQTKYGNSWAATLAGPLAGAIESTLGDFVMKNIQQAGKGEETHFLGDALYAGGRYVPGSSLWFARLAFQRHVLDQLALMADPRTPERFARIEEKAQKEWGQRYWWQPGRQEPRRAPEFETMLGPR
jgi:hypothetical protein